MTATIRSMVIGRPWAAIQRIKLTFGWSRLPLHTKKALKYLAVPVALLISAVMVMVASQAAFTAQTTNPGNGWSSGKIQLTDSQNGVAMFDEKDLFPGAKGAKDIEVTYEGSADAMVKMFSAGGDGMGSALAGALKLKIERTGGTTVFDGTMAGLSAHNNYDNGLSPWEAPSGELGVPMNYTISWELSEDAPEDASGSAVKLDFVWEAKTTA